MKIILPVYKTTRQVRRQFKNMSEQREAQNSKSAFNEPTKEAPKQKEGEYIDFEEVK
ncbi:DUF4834 family protein [Niabella ginsengisoli]|uniref:DUF4834 family protein n=1 Tax=Niabella ginsengisoli TaxID=522298 RepID=A0ABS9SPJ8_9BACT|nr:DUF4834 family protein [Niabella ginsengisoli]MCH5600171.1 DUF4834 family protein [Niabella ginsengisoli]